MTTDAHSDPVPAEAAPIGRATPARSILDFRADPAQAEPPYLQLRAYVTDGVQRGDFLPGERLPTVRALAAASGLAANTIASAYRALDAAGVIEGRGRAGTFIKLGVGGDETARAAAQAYAVHMSEMGYSADRAEELVRDAFRALPSRG